MSRWRRTVARPRHPKPLWVLELPTVSDVEEHRVTNLPFLVLVHVAQDTQKASVIIPRRGLCHEHGSEQMFDVILKCVCEAALKNVEEEVRERCGEPMMLDNSTLWDSRSTVGRRAGCSTRWRTNARCEMTTLGVTNLSQYQLGWRDLRPICSRRTRSEQTEEQRTSAGWCRTVITRRWPSALE